MTPQDMTGKRVVDNRGDTVGKLTDVMFSDGPAADPQWAIVSHGTLKTHRRVVPMSQMYESGFDDDDPHLVVNMDKDVVRHAPEIGGRDDAVTPEFERVLVDYYGSAV